MQVRKLPLVRSIPRKNFDRVTQRVSMACFNITIHFPRFRLFSRFAIAVEIFRTELSPQLTFAFVEPAAIFVAFTPLFGCLFRVLRSFARFRTKVALSIDFRSYYYFRSSSFYDLSPIMFLSSLLYTYFSNYERWNDIQLNGI